MSEIIMEIKLEPIDENTAIIKEESLSDVVIKQEETFTITEIMEQDMKCEVQIKEEKTSWNGLVPINKISNYLLLREEHNYAKSYNELEENSSLEVDENGILFEEVSDELDTDEENYEKFPKMYDLSLKCPECPMFLEDKLRLNRHRKIHIGPKWQCNTCLKRFKRQSSLTNHFCDLQCSICNGTCKCPLISDPSTCKICLKIDFRYFEDYKFHMLQYHNEVIFCKFCEIKRNTYYKHKQLKHKLIKHYQCPECLIEISTKELLASHLTKFAKYLKCKNKEIN